MRIPDASLHGYFSDDWAEELDLIKDFSQEGEESINRLFFQELVISNLSAQEQKAYVQMLLEKRCGTLRRKLSWGA